ncbi:MAG: ATP-grasp domain-containing protein [Syntrophales bacterium]|nr:ATP-grasp domain-containing protein [Syntrophales bacterium]
MNILVSCVGRQTMLVSAFRSALRMEVDEKSRLFTSDMNPYASGLALGDDRFFAPPIGSQDYPNWIVDLCRVHKIDLIFTLHVPELLILEGIRDRLKDIGCQLIGIPHASIIVCLDKVETARFCLEHGLDHPRIWVREEVLQEKELPWPLIAKDRFGQGCRGQQILWCQKELENFFHQKQSCKNFIFQEFIEGQEYGIDVINDLKRNHRGILVRRKIAMRDGETDIAVTEEADSFLVLGHVLSTTLKHQGLLDVDIICQGRKQFVIDLNPRFGGGYPFSHIAGANVPAAYIRWATGREAEPEWMKPIPGVVGARGSEVWKVNISK